LLQQAVVARVVSQRLGDAQQPRVLGQRQAKWFLGQAGDFIKDHLGNSRLWRLQLRLGPGCRAPDSLQ